MSSKLNGEKDDKFILSVISYLFMRLPFILLAGIVMAAAVFAFSKYCITPQYKSYITLYVYNTPTASEFSNSAINDSDLKASEGLADTYAVIVRSNSMLDLVVDGVNDRKKYKIARKELEDYIDVGKVNNTQIIKISIMTDDPEKSCEIAKVCSKIIPDKIVDIAKAGSSDVLDYPEVSHTQAYPNVLKNTVLGFILGSILTIAVFIIIVLSDKKMYFPEDVTNYTGLTVIGQIPEIPTDNVKVAPYIAVKGGIIENVWEQNKSESIETSDN